jgi:FkbH-like protein
MARRRYLQPMARALVGALDGSASHAALYFDERMRYMDASALPAELRQTLRKHTTIEFSAIAEILRDALPVELVERELLDFHKPLLNPPDPTAKILFIGDCIFVETRAFLSQYSTDHGHPADIRHVFFSTKQPMADVNTAVVNEVQRYQPDLIGLSLFTFEGVPPYTYAWRKAALPFTGNRVTSIVDGLVELVRQTIADIRTVSDCTVAVHVPCGVPLDRLRRRMIGAPAHSRGQRRLLAYLSEGLHELAASVENVLALDEAALAADLGGIRAAAAYAFAEEDVPPGYSHTTALGPALARHYDQLLTDHDLLGRAKALLVDFDNTLWQGVMAEGPVAHNADAQQLLLGLKNAGVLLVALSKNDESSIRWHEMVLSEDDFVLKKINWLPKPDNASAAIKELDLAPDAFALLDDNPVERALVTHAIPGIKALDPTTPQAWQALHRWLAFPSTRQTDEARRRTIMYREAAERRAAMSQTHDYGAMMKTLGLCYSIAPATASDLPRVMELIERTNQFNTTTRRRSTAEVQALLSSPASRVDVASLRDKFGNLGVVAVAIFDQSERLFDSVIMSCRAMGFGLEFALLRAVMDDTGPGLFRGLLVATDRNGPAADFFAQAGFRRESDSIWTLPPDSAGPQVPSWLTRE